MNKIKKFKNELKDTPVKRVKKVIKQWFLNGNRQIGDSISRTDLMRTLSSHALDREAMQEDVLQNALSELIYDGFVIKQNDELWSLTKRGFNELT